MECASSLGMDPAVDLVDAAERAVAFLCGAASANARQGGAFPSQPAGCVA